MKRGLVLAAFLAGGQAHAQALTAPVDGYLCCNLAVEDGWISDINFHAESGQVLAAGTPVTVLGHGRQRVKLRIDGREVALGNDYSRQLDLPSFQQRYVVAMDPRDRLRSASAEVQAMVAARQIAPGLDRQQVLMSLGYPVARDTPDLSGKRWTYFFRDEEQRFWVMFDDAGVVESVRGDDAVIAVVAPSMLSPERQAAARAGEPPCALNVYRPTVKHWNASRERVSIYLDDQSVGAPGTGETLCLEPTAGAHRLTFRDSVGGLPSIFKGPEQVIEVVVGKPLFYRFEKTLKGMTWTGVGAAPLAHSDFSTVSEAMWRSRE